MSFFSKFKIGSTSYDVKDAAAGKSLSISGNSLSLKNAAGTAVSTVNLPGGKTKVGTFVTTENEKEVNIRFTDTLADGDIVVVKNKVGYCWKNDANYTIYIRTTDANTYIPYLDATYDYIFRVSSVSSTNTSLQLISGGTSCMKPYFVGSNTYGSNKADYYDINLGCQGSIPLKTMTSGLTFSVTNSDDAAVTISSYKICFYDCGYYALAFMASSTNHKTMKTITLGNYLSDQLIMLSPPEYAVRISQISQTSSFCTKTSKNTCIVDDTKVEFLTSGDLYIVYGKWMVE